MLKSNEVTAIVLQINAVENGDRILILPLGEIQGRDGRRWILTRGDAGAVVDKVHAEGVDIVIDYDHGTYAGSGKAAGWLRDFKADAQGITAVAEFTPAAEESIDNKEFRYLSPAFLSEGERILALESVGLVNTPNIADLPALNANMPCVEAGKEASGKLELQLNAAQDENARLKKENKELLLSVNAFESRIAEREQTARQAEIEDMVALAVANGRLAPAQKDSAVKIGLNSRSGLEELIAKSPLNLKMLSRTQAGEGLRPSSVLDEVELAMCAHMGISPEDFKKNKSE
ncbi:MAG: phage protease [Thermodesulfobacteriota bacterium]|nr:phage protease [Thermodesulfobacteriota bacterium]